MDSKEYSFEEYYINTDEIDESGDDINHKLAEEESHIEELEFEKEEHPFEEDEDEYEEPQRKKLKRELKAEALRRLENAARTVEDFKEVARWWDRLDANRERRERYHEICRSGDDVPFDYGMSANELFYPDTLNDVLAKQERKGDFIDLIFNCPYDIHELVTDKYLSQILKDLKDEQKELLFLYAVRLYSSVKIGAIRHQSDRNIRKVRATLIKRIRKKLYIALKEKAANGEDVTLMERWFLEDYAENGGNK